MIHAMDSCLYLRCGRITGLHRCLRRMFALPLALSREPRDLPTGGICAVLCCYGHSTPNTVAGKIFTILYAMVGIPLCLVLFHSIGERLNKVSSIGIRQIKKILKRSAYPRLTDLPGVSFTLPFDTSRWAIRITFRCPTGVPQVSRRCAPSGHFSEDG
ncbi:Two pore potassium channel protein sup-9 [Portunus trituberculatus]|uniref:Two pore potassium channel protein sup-9 n=1 Tax=Portunus trituberculatus TaxID=210409 RepID=A0A5B7DRM1_PORTR|nr:Two pore potassium channel protein sup-9 [Portunus trituberculatus]